MDRRAKAIDRENAHLRAVCTAALLCIAGCSSDDVDRDRATPDSSVAQHALDAALAPVITADAATAMDARSGPEPAAAGAHADAQTSGQPDSAAPASTPPAAGVPTLFWLDAAQGRVIRGDPSTRKSTPIVTRMSATPDGIAVDAQHGLLYWTNMGVPQLDDGFILRTTLDGSQITTIVPQAGTFTPKQLKLDAARALLYWSDREGMRVMRARTDGSQLETLIVTGSGDAARADAANWAVGIALDVDAKQVYWTQKGPDNGHEGSIRRAGSDPIPGADPAHRSDIEILFAGLPEPIDLELDLSKRQLYWTDRGDNTVSRAPLDVPPGVAPDARADREILVRGAGEAIGIALDLARDAMYYTALEGTVSTAHLNGTEPAVLFRNQGSLTGIAFVEVPP